MDDIEYLFDIGAFFGRCFEMVDDVKFLLKLSDLAHEDFPLVFQV